MTEESKHPLFPKYGGREIEATGEAKGDCEEMMGDEIAYQPK